QWSRAAAARREVHSHGAMTSREGRHSARVRRRRGSVRPAVRGAQATLGPTARDEKIMPLDPRSLALFDALQSGKLTRRQFARRLAGLGFASSTIAALVAACGPAAPAAPAGPPTVAPSAFPPARPTVPVPGAAPTSATASPA